MKIQVNTDKNIAVDESLVAEVEGAVRNSLIHVSTHVTRVEVHLSDENGDKEGQYDMRCMLEARLEGRQPTAVTCEAETLTKAISGAAEKLKTSLERTLDKLHEYR